MISQSRHLRYICSEFVKHRKCDTENMEHREDITQNKYFWEKCDAHKFSHKMYHPENVTNTLNPMLFFDIIIK